jgi:hypothetical protein
MTSKNFLPAQSAGGDIHLRDDEIAYLFLYTCLMISNLIIILKCRVYKNWSSLFILGALTLVCFVRIGSLLFQSLYESDYRHDEIMGRLTHDIPFFLFDCVTISLLLQWVQTYQVLIDPQRAIKSIVNNTYPKVQITITLVYLVLIGLDAALVTYDSKFDFTKEKVHTASTTIEIVLASATTVVLVCYMGLFCLFLARFRRVEEGEISPQLRYQVKTFFISIIIMLVFRTAIHWIFAIMDSVEMIATIYEDRESRQARVVDFAGDISMLVEILFNVIVSYYLA